LKFAAGTSVIIQNKSKENGVLDKYAAVENECGMQSNQPPNRNAIARKTIKVKEQVIVVSRH
jgi:hypothetical protein